MNTPRCLHEQLKEYTKAGFHVVKWEARSGAHFKIWFAEFETPQIITKNCNEPRSMKNNIARYKRLAAAQREKESANV